VGKGSKRRGLVPGGLKNLKDTLFRSITKKEVRQIRGEYLPEGHRGGGEQSRREKGGKLSNERW